MVIFRLQFGVVLQFNELQDIKIRIKTCNLEHRLYINPATFLCRTVDAIYQLLYLVAFPKIGAFDRQTGDSVEEVTHLDGFQIVEAELMSRRGTEAAIRRIIGTGGDGAEALLPARIVGLV